MRRGARRTGFTLIELVILVAGIGVLAALAYPVFIHYTRRVKTAEVGANLRSLFQGAASYYQAEHCGVRGSWRGHILGSFSCTVSPVCSPNAPSAAGQTVDLSTGTMVPFQALRFDVADPIYYQYCIEGSDGSCGHDAREALYTFRALGDLDGDGTGSTFEIAAGADVSNVLYRSPGIYVVDELE